MLLLCCLITHHSTGKCQTGHYWLVRSVTAKLSDMTPSSLCGALKLSDSPDVVATPEYIGGTKFL